MNEINLLDMDAGPTQPVTTGDLLDTGPSTTNTTANSNNLLDVMGGTQPAQPSEPNLQSQFDSILNMGNPAPQ